MKTHFFSFNVFFTEHKKIYINKYHKQNYCNILSTLYLFKQTKIQAHMLTPVVLV